MFYKVKYSPNYVNHTVLVDLKMSDKQSKTLDTVRDGTKVEFFAAAVNPDTLKDYVAAFRNLKNAMTPMGAHGFEVALPQSATFDLAVEHKVGELIVDADIDDLEVFAEVHSGIKGWYVKSISTDRTVTVEVNESKILKYGLSKFDLASPVNESADINGVLVTDIMGDVEEFHKTQTDSDLDDRYSLLK